MGRPLNVCGYVVAAKAAKVLSLLERQEATFAAALRNADKMQSTDWTSVVGENYLISRDAKIELMALLEIMQDNRLVGQTTDLTKMMKGILAAIERNQNAG